MPKYIITGEVITGWFLVLNPMRSNAENRAKFGPYETAEAAKAFHSAELVPAYSDTAPDSFNVGSNKTYRKSFRAGGPLEWMNPLTENELITPGAFGHGIFEFEISSREISCVEVT